MTKRKFHTHQFIIALGVLYLCAVMSYVIAEHKPFDDAMWWAFMTFTTVGYGDQYPRTEVGRMAGMFLTATAVFVVVPAITARVVARLAVNVDEWTHDEQEEVKYLLRELSHREGIRQYEASDN
jgi:voltage-gated potassium channel